MTNKIGEKIKQLRKKSNVTQEKFADYLGITFQAVSRWESGICYPDLELLPAIANYFGVTTDELLGVDIMNKEERIKEIQDQLRENFSKGFIDKNIEILRTAVNEFPNDYDLLSDLAFYLGKRDDKMKEAISLNERILEDCTDDQIRYGVMQKLAYDYKYIGEKEKAIATAKRLPSTPVASDMLLDSIYDGEERITQLKYNIWYFCYYLTGYIKSLTYEKYGNNKDVEGIPKRIELCKKAINIYKIIYENGDYGFYNTRVKDLYYNMAVDYMLLHDIENTIDSLEKAADYAIAFDTMPEDFKHTSLTIEGIEFSKAKNLAKDYDYNESYALLHESLSNQRYDPIREDERFKAILAKLELYAKKET
ncbi:MAG: helix-turn-helix domain-containing protein [Oscillospiraceae bacterium]|nr:helix-turn-helix domain-containing protein [Oscillospiraceae bacterium]